MTIVSPGGRVAVGGHADEKKPLRVEGLYGVLQCRPCRYYSAWCARNSDFELADQVLKLFTLGA
jgi:hypothetical protein